MIVIENFVNIFLNALKTSFAKEKIVFCLTTEWKVYIFTSILLRFVVLSQKKPLTLYQS